MSRKKVTGNEEIDVEASVEEINGLEQLANEYLKAKEEADSASARSDNLKNLLFEQMQDKDIKKIETAIGSITMQSKSTDKMDESSVIAFLKEQNVTDPIKTKEYVDLVVLEDAIRRGEISAEDIAKFIETKTSTYIVGRRRKNG